MERCAGSCGRRRCHKSRASASEKLHALKTKFETALEMYRKQKWDAAEKGFSELIKSLKDETSRVFLERITDFRRNPPGRGWDGVFHRTSK